MIIYNAFSYIQAIWSYVIRVSLICLIAVCLTHYQENQMGMSILSMLLTIVCLIITNDQIIIYNDKLIHKDNSLMSIMLNRNYKTYILDDVRNATVNSVVEKYKSNSFLDNFADTLMPIQFQKWNSERYIYLELNNSKKVKIVAHLEYDKIYKVIEVINHLTKKNCH
jgi:hypothetical protein